MITFLLSILLLVAGYFVYGKIVEKYLDVDPSRQTPAYAKADGVDFQPMSTWKVFVIQFLNIAGLGPIFGAVSGAAFGPAAYIWIVVGCIFMGAVHDFFAGMMSIHTGGMNMPEVTAKYLGKRMKGFMNFVVAFLLMAVGVSFVIGPAGLMQNLTSIDKEIWLYIIFGYYILATLLPVDKIIGSIYPFMGAILLFMAFGVGVMLIVGDINGTHEIMELTPAVLKNWHSNPEQNMIFPMMFIVISCGAISGFHATQSPMMARCLKNEKHARPVFYGAMIAEGIVAMIWATAAISYFGGPDGLNAAMSDTGTMVNGVLVKNAQAADIVDMICKSWLGKVGAVIAILGVVICPITSGDTAFRSLRLSVADFLKYDQKPIVKRLVVCLPIFVVAFFFCKVDFSTAWSYLGIANQILASLVLWTGAAYLINKGRAHWMCSIPATFLTFICVCFLMVAPLGFGLAPLVGYIAGAAVAIPAFIFCVVKGRRSVTLS
ncbi:MAG: carbon starvation protein A [Bacteroidales bacterium]|nr:carbon starvation protein A [Bacteroidales bacterium]